MLVNRIYGYVLMPGFAQKQPCTGWIYPALLQIIQVLYQKSLILEYVSLKIYGIDA